jgi:hypothetical protein
MRSHGGLREGRLCRANEAATGTCDLGNGTTDATIGYMQLTGLILIVRPIGTLAGMALQRRFGRGPS